jgi:hypothetical protein
MNIDSLIDFNKYTLAVSAGCFVYAMEKVPPVGSGVAGVVLGATLVLLAAASVFGVLVFFVATSAAHYKIEGGAIPGEHLEWIRRLGISHSVALLLGVVLLVGILVPRVFSSADKRADCDAMSIRVATAAGST